MTGFQKGHGPSADRGDIGEGLRASAPARESSAYSAAWLLALALIIVPWPGPVSAQGVGAVGGVIGGERVDVQPDRAAPDPLSGLEQKRDRRGPQVRERPASRPRPPGPLWPPEGLAPAEAGPPPFGVNLFAGGFRAEREDGLNPDYRIRPGDHVTVRLWGAMEFGDTLVVDAQGNVFIPGIGPIEVEGATNARLGDRIEAAVRRIYTQNVNVYVNVQSTTPVAVYVTGYVRGPGSFAGVASDSLLYFLDRAGGIDPLRGSFRDIRILRERRVMATADLYDFLLEGLIPRVQFQDGDTIVVGPRGRFVSVEGAARNAYAFEFPPESAGPDSAPGVAPETGLPGAALLRYARPHADASHAVVTGTRAAGPVSAYLPLSDFAELSLHDGDSVFFEADERAETMLVRIEGSHLGPSRYAVPIDATLHQMLDHIPVDPRLADTDSISIKRRSIAKRQKRALDDTLRRLETTILSATSETDEESRIRANEAELIADFVERARQVEPDGVLVVASGGRIRDLQLQNEDVITIPEKSEVVLISGEVAVPQALVWEEGADTADYIARVGGFTTRADEQQILLVRRSGEVVEDDGAKVRPGDEIIVLPEVPVKNLQLAKTIAQVLFQIAVSAGVALGI